MLMGFVGGLMIGLAAAVFLLVNGRILGASGLLGGLIDGTGWSNAAERTVFLLGLVIAPAVLVHWIPAETHVTGNWAVLVAGGTLVGLGTRLANGCTSGHGVCGMSRLSARSVVATLVYVGAGMGTMAVLRHLWGMI